MLMIFCTFWITWIYPFVLQIYILRINIIQTPEYKIQILTHFRFWLSKFVVKTVNLPLVFMWSQPLIEFSPIMKVSFQRTKRGEFCIHYFFFSICCDPKTFHLEIDHLKAIFRKKIIFLILFIGILSHFLTNYIHSKLLFRIYLKRWFFKLPLFGSTSFQIWNKLQKLFADKLTFSNLNIVFTLSVIVKSFFIFNDKLPKMLLSRLGYEYNCGCCNATYYDKIKRRFIVRIGEHLGISHLTRKKVKIDNKKLAVMQEYLLFCNYIPFFENFSILTRESNDFKLKIMQTLRLPVTSLFLTKEAPHYL